MHRSIHILAVFLLLTLASVGRAQTPLTCGIVGIDGPSEVEPGTPLVLKARTAGMLHMTPPVFKWNVSAGTITAGQGTPEITVDTAGLGGVEVIASAELSGAPLGCNGSASITTQVKAGFICGLPLDSFGDIKFEDEKARLDNFAIQLSNEPQVTGYILMSAGQTTFKNEAKQRLARAKSYLVNVREIDPNRVVTLDCGFTTDLTITFHLYRFGTTPPECSSIGVIPLSEVKFTKPRPKASKKPR